MLDARAEEVGDVAQRWPDRRRLPVDGDDRVPGRTEQQVVEPVVAVVDGERLGPRHLPLGDDLGRAAERRRLALAQLVLVAIEEPLGGGGEDLAHHGRHRSVGLEEEGEVPQLGIAPAGGVQPDEVADGDPGLLDRAAVGLHTRDRRVRGRRAGA